MRFRRMKERMLSDRLPKHRDRVKMPVSELTDGLREFCDLYLRAAMELKIENPPIGYLNISDEYAAYAIKLMVKHSAQQGMLRVLIKGEGRTLVIKAEYPEGLPPLDPLSEIFAAARNAGLETDFSYKTIIFRASLVDPNLITLRSGYRRRFLAMLEEMFFDF